MTPQDVTAALLSQEGQSRSKNPHNAEVICVEQGLYLFVRGFFRRCNQAVTGVIYQNVQTTEVLERLGQRLLTGLPRRLP